MPQHLQPSSLYLLCGREVSGHLFNTCRTLDNQLDQNDDLDTRDPVLSPRRSPPKSPSKEEVYIQLSPQHRMLMDWLSNLPDKVVEDVVQEFLAKLETHLLEDMDNKLILTLINIDKMKINDFYFGLYSLLSIIQGFQLDSLQFSKRLWYCLSQYGEITSCRYLTRTLISSMPGLVGLTQLNIAHIATDQVANIVSRFLVHLTSLDMSSSAVTDKAVKYVAGVGSITQTVRPLPSSSAVCNLTKLLDNNANSERRSFSWTNTAKLTPQKMSRGGCYKLEQLKLQSCELVTEKGVMVAVEHLENLKQLEYHQKYSLLEILIKWSSNCDNSERMMKLFKLTDIEHGFPYGLSPLSDHLTNMSMMLPHLTSLTLVTTDSTAKHLTMFSRLRRITLELEDCLGDGYLDLLTSLGHQLLDLNISCSSDPESPLSMDQVAGPAGHQGQLFNAAIIAAGQLCPGLSKLSISGCGLVSASAVRRLQIDELLANTSFLRRSSSTWFTRLSSLILMSYDDTHPAMTVHSGLLRSTLAAAGQLRVLNLEGYFGTFINDNYFSSILQTNPLTNLNILDICVSDEGSTSGRIPLSMKTVQGVLQNCINIRELRISDWSVTSEEFSQLAANIKENNWDLTVSRKSRV